MNKLFLTIGFGFLALVGLRGQIDTSVVGGKNQGHEYEIGGITVVGNQFTDNNALINISGLSVGKKITLPGDQTREAIKKLMKLRLFIDVQITQTNRVGDVVYLEIMVKERPRLSRHYYLGVPKGQHEDLNKKLDKVLVKGAIVTENMKANTRSVIKAYYVEKGFYDTQVTVSEEPDEILTNSVKLGIVIDRGRHIHIGEIAITGNKEVKTRKIYHLLKKTKVKKWYDIFHPSKLLNEEYVKDKEGIIKYYNALGHRDALITRDTVILVNDNGRKHLRVEMNIFEGNTYHYGNVVFKGNSIYSDELLQRVVGIDKGDIYNADLLQTRLNYDQAGRDISSLYMDNGYLFFRVTPVETAIRKDTIDVEVRINEGPQATIDKVIVKGNDRTHDHVILRELRTRPGEKFSRADVIRSQREISGLGYFNPEGLGLNTPVNPQKGTVDLEYTVEERPSDQLELSAGWGGAGRGIIGTVGVTFSNFSLRNISNPESWNPLPQGDGQRLSFRVQTTGTAYQSYNFSFTDPWLGGKKPNALSVAASYSNISSSYTPESSLYWHTGIFNTQVSLATRLKWPDDWFVSRTGLIYQNYAIALSTQPGASVSQFKYVDESGNTKDLPAGSYNGIAISQTLSRSSVLEPIFPRSGSNISLSVQLTPPYSLFSNRDYSKLNPTDRYKWIEYHKWTFRAEWYHAIVGNLVVKAAIKMGFLGFYNSSIGTPPFERFELGGDGITNYVGWQGREIYSLRGYDVSQVNPVTANGGSAIFNKYSLELRYPITLAPSSTIYGLMFFDGGNSWNRIRDYDPFDLKRSTGFGVRVFLPMFGTLGFDYGLGFDKALGTGSAWTQYGKFSIILGFEPE